MSGDCRQTLPTSLSGTHSIRIVSITVILDRPVKDSDFVRVLVDEERTILRPCAADKPSELKWTLDPYLVLRGESRLVIEVCKPLLFWTTQVVADAAMTVRDALERCNDLDRPQEIRLRYSPVIIIGVSNNTVNDQNHATTTDSGKSTSASGYSTKPVQQTPPRNTVNDQNHTTTTDSGKSTSASGYSTKPVRQTPPQLTQIAKAIAQSKCIFESSLAPGVGMSLRRIRLGQASKLLRQIESQCNLDELAQAKRQMLTIQCEFINLFQETDINKEDVNALFYHIGEVLDIWAWQYRRPRAEFFDAATTLRATLSSLPDTARQSSQTQAIFLGIQSLLAKSSAALDPLVVILRVEVSHCLLEETFHQAIRHFEAGRWALAMSLLQSQDSAINVLIDLENAYEKMCADDNTNPPLGRHEPHGKASLVRKEYDMQLAICRATQLIHTGDWHFKEAESGVPEDMMGRAQLAQDDYRAALLCITGHDVELEGSALARLARFYAKIVKLPVPAHQLYLRAVQLAACLSPALPNGAWYNESTAAVQAHRDELQAKETREWMARREPILEKLADDINKLRGGKGMSNREFCEFVFKTWPPKTDGSTELPSDPSNPQNFSNKHLLKVIQRYHSDRNSSWGEEWLVMSEEISKELTARYNITKGAF